MIDVGRRSSGALGGVGVVAAGLIALCLAWSSTGTEWAVVGWWLATVVLGVVLPGWCIVRVARGGEPTSSDVGWAGPAGLVLALATWLVAHLLGATLPTLVVGPAVGVLLVAVPQTRRRLLGADLTPTTSPQGHWTWPVCLVMGLAALVSARWMWSLGLGAVPPVPVEGSPTYSQDLLYQTALTGEARRSLVLEYPMVDGEPLGYHWFFHALAAQLGGSGIHDLDVAGRLLPSTLVLLLILVAGAVGHQVVGNAAGAVGAAVAIALYRPMTPEAWTPNAIQVIANYWQLSPTATLGWVFGLATTGCLVAVLRRGTDDHLAPSWLAVPFAVGAAGAKSTQLPVLIAGVALAGFVWLVAGWRQRDWARTCLRYVVTLVVLGVITGLAIALLYPGSYGLRYDPSVWARMAKTQVYGSAPADFGQQLVAAGISMVRRWVPTFIPCLGAVVLVRRSALDPSGWIGIGVLVAGMVAVVTLTHPGASQYYFLIAAVPIALALSGAGVGWGLREVWVRAHRGRVWAFLLLGAGAVVATLLANSRYRASRSPLEIQTSLGLVPAGDLGTVASWTAPTLLLVACIGLVALAVWLLLRRQGVRRVPGAWISLLTAGVLVAGTSYFAPMLAATTATPAATAARVAADVRLQRPAMTPALFDAGRYLREHAQPSDIIATNRVWVGTTRAGGRDNRDFSVVAFSGLRTDVSGYGYAPRVLVKSAARQTSAILEPFWDPPRLAAELALVTAPTRERLDAAYRERGVRWILADERSGPVSSQLAALTDVVSRHDGVWLARLRPPPS